MRKIIITLLIFFLIAMCGMTMLCACDNAEDQVEPSYQIVYSDGEDTHTLTVRNGEIFTIYKPLPQKQGYEFVGLYDSDVGGTQYVTSTGISVTAFNEGRNIILYPRFKAKEYTLFLDYQGAQVTGMRQHTVSYGERLPELPINISEEHKTFIGWYTEPNCQGKQVADQYGLISTSATLNENNFDLSSESLNLYAGFEVEKYKVTCYFKAGVDNEEFLLEYYTPVSQIVSETRVDGKAPISWSKREGGEVFNGKITGETVLYAVEYAPIITFSNEGGNAIQEIIARVGTIVSLPTPIKNVEQFSHWEDINGAQYQDTITMPDNSLTIRAVWEPYSYAYYKNSIKQTITDGSQNYYDTFDFRAMFGHSVEEYKAAGYKSVRFSITVLISEIEDGYQEVYLSQSSSKSGSIWQNTNIEHGGSKKILAN